MSIYELTVTPGTDDVFEQDVELDGRVYTLRFAWNTRDESWVMSVLHPDGTGLAMGRKIVLGIPLLQGEIDSRLPPGLLMATDTTNQGLEPGRSDLGRRVVLAYYDAEEVAA